MVDGLSDVAVLTSDPLDLSEVDHLSDTISADYLEHYCILPIGIRNGKLLVATWAPAVDLQTLDELEQIFAAESVVVHATEAELRPIIRRLYGEESKNAERLIAALDPAPDEPADIVTLAIDDLRAQANEAPVIRLVNLLLLEALEGRASDVHLEASEQSLRVRYRIDGVLQDAPSPPAHFKAAVVSRLKIMADLDIAERRLPQDGRIRLQLKNRAVDVRVSTLPTTYGESVVLRLLDQSRTRIGLLEMGMAEDTLATFSSVLAKPHGMVLVTGPTGSGKTTTLYAAVDRIRTGREKILTVEDPVEYNLPGVNQVPINARIGLTFATALRALLRQDPDILLIGEIRDPETAEIAIQAALTGHLVLATLHTNTAAGALTRLLDLGIPDYLITSTVEAVLAQRLVRRNCPACTAATEDDSWAAGFGLQAKGSFLAGAGCSNCRQSGFHGRTGIFELLRVSERVRAAIHGQERLGTIEQIAKEEGMRFLLDDGLRQILNGVTTPQEVLRVSA